MRLALALVAVLIASPALAVDGKLVVSEDKQETIFVWKDEAALLDGEAVLAANAGDLIGSALNDGFACGIRLPQRVITADPTPDIIRVIVVGGEHAGCRGLVRRENFVPKR
ncbi:hypothetical protein [Aureimonas leprariae]|uniref:Uncharacterized protein n=1 Tax=Plantimonas leprariae TaxID=2615207 RepID=A0A7V7PKX8_9HYPH|nr:hypothetical protein [Aureimonas leprariae]KAB0676720.1 hypothetical protein F6X38_20685 [Aureimonas leprariae]